jgi:hypothetical protein
MGDVHIVCSIFRYHYQWIEEMEIEKDTFEDLKNRTEKFEKDLNKFLDKQEEKEAKIILNVLFVTITRILCFAYPDKDLEILNDFIGYYYKKKKNASTKD